MSAEWLSAASLLATLVVVTVTAYAALRQMRHMRSANQVAALLPLIEEYQNKEISDAERYLFGQLAKDLESPENRAGVISVPATGPTREVAPLLNFYESCGALVLADVVDFELLLRYFLLPSEVWTFAQDYIELSRVTRGNEAFENIEALVMMEQKYAARHGISMYPKGLPRIPPRHRYPESSATR